MRKKQKFSKTHAAQKARALTILDRLDAAYPDAGCSLHYQTPFQLLVAVVLSAQCTDAKVNAVLPRLFARFPRPRNLAEAPVAEVEAVIRPLGLYKTKAANIIQLAARTKGLVPETFEEIVALPGVGRKTANVVVTELYRRAEGIAVDTHCGRLARRLGLSRHHDAHKIEIDLTRIVPPDRWHVVTHLFIAHGRAICRARTTYCRSCALGEDLCPAYDPDRGSYFQFNTFAKVLN